MSAGRPDLRVIPGQAPDVPAHVREPRRRLAEQVGSALLRTFTGVFLVHPDGSITVTFDKRAALAVRALITWSTREH